MENQEFSPFLKTILREMCNRVGANYDTINFKKPNWFHEKSWTTEEQDDFRNWLTNYIFTNKKAREDLATFSIKNKRLCKQFADEFVFNYGWKLKELEKQLNEVV